VRTGISGLRGTVIEPGFHTTPVKFARTLFTVEIDCIVGATFSTDITFHFGELTTLAECAERYRTDTSIGTDTTASRAEETWNGIWLSRTIVGVTA
jgi:carotenoid cleavage dioxygenase-like enzyme